MHFLRCTFLGVLSWVYRPAGALSQVYFPKCTFPSVPSVISCHHHITTVLGCTFLGVLSSVYLPVGALSEVYLPKCTFPSRVATTERTMPYHHRLFARRGAVQKHLVLSQVLVLLHPAART